MHAVHDDLDFVYAAFGVCDCNGASLEDSGDVVLGLYMGGDGVGGWGWGVGVTKLFLNIAFKYLRARRGESGGRDTRGA